MSDCPTCGAPKPNEDWDWSKEHMWNAAPELLDVCKELFMQMRREGGGTQRMLERALAVIRKAEGSGE